jgi:rubrerythrin
MGISSAKVTQRRRGERGRTRLQIETVPLEPGRSEEVADVNGDPIFFSAGTTARGEYYCAECGYGIAVRTVLPECPMCRGVQWEEPSTSPYGRSSL